MLEDGQDKMKISVPRRSIGDSGRVAEVPNDDNSYGCGCAVIVEVYNGILLSSQGHSTDLLCPWLWSVSYYVSQYGFLGTSNLSNTIFLQPNISGTLLANRINLKIPLNISARFALKNNHLLSDYGTYLDLDFELFRPYGVAWENPNDSQRPFFPQPSHVLGIHHWNNVQPHRDQWEWILPAKDRPS